MELVSQHPFGAGGLQAKKFKLANGLKVILVRDPSAPVFAYQTWFAVGSRHEREGITGIAHLFEHLMFNQTETLAPGELDRRIESAGGDTNAATWVDWTYYRDNLPRAELALAVELESDRMAHLVLGDTQVESEREVVANERRFRVEDDVDGFLNEELYKLAFTTHPYHWPTIGWMRDIEAITIDDCRAFYRTYYAPNNATVVLVGDVDEDAALALIEQRYGGLPAQQLPAEPSGVEPEQTAEKRASYAKPITADKLRIGFKAPPLSHADYPVLEVVSEILFGGNSSRLHRRLVVDGEIASSVHASSAPFRDPGLYEISVSLQRGHGAAEAEAIVYEELAKLANEPLAAHELETAQTRLLTHFMRELRPSSGKAEALGHYETTVGDYRKLFAVADGYRAVTAADLQRAAKTYLIEARRTVLLGRAEQGAFMTSPSTATSDPVAGANVAVGSLPGPAGSRLLVEENHDLPLVRFQLALRVGAGDDPAERDGLCNFATELMGRGAGGRTRAELDAAFDALGTSLDVLTDYDGVTFDVTVLPEKLEAALTLVADVILRPDFPEDEAQKLVRELNAHLDELRDDDGQLARRFFTRALYAGHPYGRTVLGTDATLKTLDGASARAWHQHAMHGGNVIFGVAGDIRTADVEAAVARHFAALPAGTASPGARPEVPRRRGLRLTIVDKPERTQSQILMGQPAPRWHHPDFVALQVATTAFGGTFTARLMDEVRSKRGLSYGASARVGQGRGAKALVAHVFPSLEQTPETLQLVLGLWKAWVQEGVTEDEVAFARGYLSKSFAFTIATPEDWLELRTALDLAGMPADSGVTYSARVSKVTREASVASLAKHLTGGDLEVVIVTTAEELMPKLVEAGLTAGVEVEVVAYDSY